MTSSKITIVKDDEFVMTPSKIKKVMKMMKMMKMVKMMKKMFVIVHKS